jgi:predicted translin family RNA/ssDNA-binding protein
MPARLAAAPQKPRPLDEQISAKERLEELRRALQRRIKRKLTAYELTALDHAATMLLRSEMALRDIKTSANDIVRLHGAAREAVKDFEEVCGLATTAPGKGNGAIPSHTELGLP